MDPANRAAAANPTYDLYDAVPEKALDDLAALAARVCEAPIAAISLLVDDKMWLKSKVGVTVDCVPLEGSFCAHIISKGEMLVVPDAQEDERFAESPLVTGELGIRFYSGFPLSNSDGKVVGSLCILDVVPRSLEENQEEAFKIVGRQVMAQFELGRQAKQLGDREARFRLALEAADLGPFEWDLVNDVVICPETTERLFGFSPGEFDGRFGTWSKRVFPEDLQRFLLSMEESMRQRIPLVDEFRVNIPDGSVRWISGRGEFVFDEQGKAVRMHGVVRDVTDRKLADQELLLRTVALDHSLNGFDIISEDKKFVYANRAYLDMWGYGNLRELEGESPASHCLDPDLPAKIISEIKKQGSCTFEFTARRKDGSTFEALMAARLLHDADGNELYIGSSIDITEKKRAEETVRHLNRVHAMVSEINQTIVREKDPQTMLAETCRIAVDRGGFVTTWIGLFDDVEERYRVAAYAGATEETMRIVGSLLGGKGQRPGCEYTAEALESGSYAVCNDISAEPDSVVWKEAALSKGYRSLASLPLQIDGEIVGNFNLYASDVGFFDDEEMRLLGRLGSDISFALDLYGKERERIQAERALLKSKAQLSNAMKIAQLCYWEFDPETDLFHLNDPFFELFHSTADVVGGYQLTSKRFIECFCHEEDRVLLEEEIARLRRSPIASHASQFEHRALYGDGEAGHMAVGVFSVKDDDGEKVRILGVNQDVSRRRQLEEELRQSQKLEAIGQLAGGVAHDFNNILTIIQGYGSILMMDRSASGEAREAVTEIVHAAERAASLTRQLLAFSRRQVMQPQDLDINASVRNLTKMLRRILGEDIGLKLDLSEVPLATHADPGMIDQILLNLVVNARDAMPSGGELTIKSEKTTLGTNRVNALMDSPPGDYVVLSVRDTGTGISEENLAKIFEPFFTTKEQGKGTGLGLSTVFGIVKQHGGCLYVESEPEGGTEFLIYLPVAEGSIPSNAAVERIRNRADLDETILLVEDETSVRLLVRHMLERAGYRVQEAASGVEALRLWESLKDEIDLLFTDIVMPGGINGLELANQLKAITPDLKVIFTSGYSPDIAGRELEFEEGQNFLQKPAPREKVLCTVRQVLDGDQPLVS